MAKLKAYRFWIGEDGWMYGTIICFCSTPSRAKTLGIAAWPGLEPIDWIDTRVQRMKHMDAIADHYKGDEWTADCNDELPEGFKCFMTEDQMIECDLL